MLRRITAKTGTAAAASSWPFPPRATAPRAHLLASPRGWWRTHLSGTATSAPVVASPQLSFHSSPLSRNAAATTTTFHSAMTIPTAVSALATTFDLPDPSALGSSSVATTTTARSPTPLVKIIATIGPTSEQRLPLQQVTAAGMSVMRLNFSHATPEEVELRTANLQAAVKALSGQATHVQDTRAVLLDTKGPEIRTGRLRNDQSGHDTITLTKGDTITLVTDATLAAASTTDQLYIDYPSLATAVSVGGKVLLDDGTIALTVAQCHVDRGTVTCTIDNTGSLRSRAGVNLPLADTSDLPALSDKDRADIKYGMASADIDFVAASFVQSADGVAQIRQHIANCAVELGWDPATQSLPLLISKIETAGALRHFDAILAASDGIMVARGDLGVEIPLQQVTNAQKEMIYACNAAGKPVIVATQMLESMQKNPRPTRAEVADVTNAVYDGADCVMLSGESAKGKYPAETVQFMQEIIVASERYAELSSRELAAMGHPSPRTQVPFRAPATVEAALAQSAVDLASLRGSRCKAILVLSNYGTLPPLVAAFRPDVPVVVLCPTAKLARQLQIYRGIHPIVFPLPANVNDKGSSMVMTHAVDEAQKLGYVTTGDEIVFVSRDYDPAHSSQGTVKIATVS